jgi:hypothetical protein
MIFIYENELIMKFNYYVCKILKKIRKLFMGEEKTTTDIDRIRLENDISFNKNTTLVSTGALVLSVGFIEKLIPISTSSSLFLLYFSWLFFVSSLLINLISFLIGSEFGNKLSIDENKNNITDEEYNTRVIKHNKLINNFNWSIFGILCLGILSLILFIFINFNNKHMSTANSNKKTNVEYLTEGTKYSLKKENLPKTVTIQKPVNTNTTIIQTNDTITIKIENKP